jgi:hypothetical protein
LSDVPLASFYYGDPDTGAEDFEAVIHWGDGSSTSVGDVTTDEEGYQVAGSHLYDTPGAYLVTIDLTNSETFVSTHLYSSIAVMDQTIDAEGTGLAATEGVALSDIDVATFLDDDPDSDPGEFSATLDWGDGLTSAGVIAGSAGAYTVSGSHTYGYAGSFTVRTLITSNGAGRAVAYTSIGVAPASEPGGLLQIAGIRFSGLEGLSTGTIEVGYYVDLDPAHPIVCHDLLIDWGDGSTSAGWLGVASGGIVPILGSHAYTSAGNYLITITVDYHDLDSATAYCTASISDASLDDSPVGSTSAVSGPLNNVVVGYLYDENTNESSDAFAGTIYWGDGATSFASVHGSNVDRGLEEDHFRGQRACQTELPSEAGSITEE